MFDQLSLKLLRNGMPIYPHYDPPEQFPPFVLDNGGLFYINCIEKAASALEMSAIGAKNVALLTKEYILQMKKTV